MNACGGKGGEDEGSRRHSTRPNTQQDLSFDIEFDPVAPLGSDIRA